MGTGHTAKEKRARVKEAEDALREVFRRLYKDRGDELTDKLLVKFGSPGAVLEAGKHQLMKTGVGESNALLLSLMPDIVRHVERNRMGKHPSVRTLNAAERFLKYRFMGESVEKFYLLALDNSGKLIECVMLQSGTEDSAPFYLKHVLAEVVRTGAKYVVLTHNHPNNTPQPSDSDIDCTNALIDSLQVIGVPLLDHIIMMGTHALSIRGFGYVIEGNWRMQAENQNILKNWLKDWDMEKAADKLRHLARHR